MEFASFLVALFVSLLLSSALVEGIVYRRHVMYAVKEFISNNFIETRF